MTRPEAGHGVALARWAVLALFFASGLAFATWASRLVMVRGLLGVSPGAMGVILLLGSIGSIAAMPLAGSAVQVFGIRRTLGASGGLALAALMAAGWCAQAGIAAGTAATLVGLCMGIGVWDVAMNLGGADVERALGRSVMPHFHAAFSLGTVAAAGIGVLMAGLGVPLLAHFGIAALASGALLVWGTANVLVDAAPNPRARPGGADPAGPRPSRLRAALKTWSEARTLLIGLTVLAMTLAEGAATDWLASGLVQDFVADESVGILGLGVFLTAMTAMRVVGTRLIDRFGRAAALRLSALLAIAGLAAYGLAPWLPLAVAGAAVWGMGSALGFPIGMSAAGEDSATAAQRTSVVSTIGYGAFLMGPPLLGMLADSVGFRGALLVLVAPVTLALALSGVMGPRVPPRLPPASLA
ncbi:MAG: MFS transporter [Bifidobacteriaceae bacterium]|jgi:MFS family permease|nr:MFS transporter [Bifidobacteriaceae bacterium]